MVCCAVLCDTHLQGGVVLGPVARLPVEDLPGGDGAPALHQGACQDPGALGAGPLAGQGRQVAEQGGEAGHHGAAGPLGLGGGVAGLQRALGWRDEECCGLHPGYWFPGQVWVALV